MATTDTANIQIDKITVGTEDGTWGSILNTNFDEIDAAIFGYVAIDCSGSSDVTPTRAQWLNRFIKLTGTLTGNINFILPTIEGKWTIWNASSGAFTITAKTAAGTGVAITQGDMMTVVADGTNIISGAPWDIAQGGTGAATAAAAATALGATKTGLAWPFSAVETVNNAASPKTLVAGDDGKLFVLDVSGGTVTLTLPDAATVGDGWWCAARMGQSAANVGTVQRAGSDVIGSGPVTSRTFTALDDGSIFVCDGTQWWDYPMRLMLGDTGSGGRQGFLPAPAAGDAAANKFFHADGTYKITTISKSFESSETSITAGSVHAIAHGLGAVPKLFQVVIRCKSAESQYAVGDELDVTNSAYIITTAHEGISAYSDATNINVTVKNIKGQDANGDLVTLTAANWRIVARAWL